MIRKFIGLFLIACITACRQLPRTLTEDTLFEFTESDLQYHCGDSIKMDSCHGQLNLKKNGKCLYHKSCGDGDSAIYYRGTYAVTDSGLCCTFSEMFIFYNDCPDCPRPKNKPPTGSDKFAASESWSLILTRTGCATIEYVKSISGADHARWQIYRKANNSDQLAFCNSVSHSRAFLDFQCKADQQVVIISEESLVKNKPVIDQVVEYYENKNKQGRSVRSENDTLLMIEFYDSETSDEKETFSRISICKKEKDQLMGDLDDDGVPEIIVPVLLSDGLNTTWYDYLLFTGKNGKRMLKSVSSGFDLAVCKAGSYSGSFVAQTIIKGKIVGVSTCYTSEDAECCPSVHTQTTVRFKDGHLQPDK